MTGLALAENLRTSKKAAIKRASAAARRKLGKIDESSQKELTRIYKRAVDELKIAVNQYAGRDNTIRLEVLQNLLAQARARLTQLENEKLDLLDKSMIDAAAEGIAPFETDSTLIGESLPQLANQAVETVRNFIAEDGLQLSDRIWKVDRQARRVVQEAIEQSVIQGYSASQAAQALLSSGQSVPPDVQRKMRDSDADKIGNEIEKRVLKEDGNPYTNALRLFRTEINRAHGEAYQATAFKHPDVIGTRFLLSPRHPRVDICDLHATVNKYGLGPGVYPKDKNPWPAHPNTLSFLEVVFSDEVPKTKVGKEDRISFLKRQDPAIQSAILNSRKKAQALELGLLTENQITTPWNVLKQRYLKRGIDPGDWQDVLKIKAPEPKQRFLNPKRPVSEGLEIVGYKSIVKEVLSNIDRIHDDGELPKIPIKRSASKKYYGAYIHRIFGGDPVEIHIAEQGTHKMLTAAHEIGHFIDHQGIGIKGRFASETEDLFQGWRDAVEKSSAIKALRKSLDGPALVETEKQTYRIDKNYGRYLLRIYEIWARSYAQYIAEKTSDGEMLRGVNQALTDLRPGSLYYFSQWEKEDFAPIKSEIDKIFKNLGWLK